MHTYDKLSLTHPSDMDEGKEWEQVSERSISCRCCACKCVIGINWAFISCDSAKGVHPFYTSLLVDVCWQAIALSRNGINWNGFPKTYHFFSIIIRIWCSRFNWHAVLNKSHKWKRDNAVAFENVSVCVCARASIWCVQNNGIDQLVIEKCTI